MSSFDWIQSLLFMAIFIGLTPLIGQYMANVFTAKRTFLHPAFGWLEELSYRVGGIDSKEEMSWIVYARVLMLFNFVGFVVLFIMLVTQNYLPLNPQNLSAVSWQLAFNTAMSFVTNTDWQAYSGEVTLSNFTQMVGLTVQNFLSAATGLGVLLVLIRGFTRKDSKTIGNFWVDLVRSIVYLLLPLSIVLALVLVSEGAVQTLSSSFELTTIENQKQIIPLGPVASQVAIKQLGTNGGGFFGVNGAHPFENPTGLTNFLESLAILLIPAATVYAYGVMIGSKKHAWILYSVMLIFWLGGLAVSAYSENLHNPVLNAYPLLEGKETRFGVSNSFLWSVSTTATSNGSVNSALSSLSPLAGGIALFNMMIGEAIFGGVGVGLCSMIMFVLLTVFLSGLMVGRTPEYLGKKIEKREMLWVMLAILLPGCLVLLGAGISVTLSEALSSIGNQGPHGLSEILYAFTSSAGNNGSSFGGLNADTNFYNIVLGIVIFLGRLATVLSSLAIAGYLAKKKITPPSVGTFSTNSLLFFILLISVILVEGTLTFFPALTLGPFMEHLLMLEGYSF